MEDWQREALRRHRMAILADLHVDYVLDHLLSRQIIFEEHIEVIKLKFGRRNRARYLLDLLPLQGSNAYSEFIESLQEPYQWLADLLRKESAETLTKAESSQSIDSGNVQNQQVILNPGEMKQMLENVGLLLRATGKLINLCSDVLAIVKGKSNNCVCGQNPINFPKNEPTTQHAHKQITLDRLRGGNGGSEDETVLSGKENAEIPPPSLSVLFENSLDLNGTKPSKNIAAVDNIINSIDLHEDSNDGVFGGGVTCSEEKCDKPKASHGEGGLHNGLPDSANDVLRTPSRTSQRITDNDSSRELHPDVKEMRTFLDVLFDMQMKIGIIEEFLKLPARRSVEEETFLKVET
ncbi:uncharacterized protein [Hetaerina americana]|uniref:uncharacterized protein n=1 Tax=Hetaerina americana TaxID=62018 RepID=UPI003A7F346C